MKALAANVAVIAGLSFVLALAGETSLAAQTRKGADASNDNASRYCMSPYVDDGEQVQLYCEGWRAVRKGW